MLVHKNKQRKRLGVGARKITHTTLHFRMVLKKWRITETSAARGEERVKEFGAVVDVLITASGENFKASELVYFSSGVQAAAISRWRSLSTRSSFKERLIASIAGSGVSLSSSWASVTAR